MALSQPRTLHNGNALQQTLAFCAGDASNIRVGAHAVPLQANWTQRPMSPLGLNRSPEPENRHVLREENELWIRWRDAALPGERCQSREPHGGSVISRGRIVSVLIVFGSELDFVGGQQRRQPAQFPAVPLAPLARM